MSKFFSESVKFVVRQEQHSAVNAPMVNPILYKSKVNIPNQYSVNMRYKQEHNRRKHKIKQPGVDVQRKNFNRKDRR